MFRRFSFPFSPVFFIDFESVVIWFTFFFLFFPNFAFPFHFAWQIERS